MKKSRRKDAELFVKLEFELLNSAAWTAMTCEAQWVYIELKKQFNFNSGGFDHLILPYSKVKWRMSNKTFFKKIAELVEYGFIECVKRGGIMKQPNVYALREKWKEKSREIVTTEGKEAIRLGLAKRRGHGVIENLKSKIS